MCADPCRCRPDKYSKDHLIFAPPVLLGTGQRKTAAHHVLGVMHQVGMSVSRDQHVERVSSVPHTSCVPEAHAVTCPSPAYPWVRSDIMYVF